MACWRHHIIIIITVSSANVKLSFVAKCPLYRIGKEAGPAGFLGEHWNLVRIVVILARKTES